MSSWVERPFSKEEVRNALNSMEEDKALSPNGFPSKFLSICWEVVGKKVMEVFNEFYSKDQWCRSLSATFISLIPKNKGAAELKDFRPISLVGCLYKLLAKTLALRFRSILGGVISESQHAFLANRQMSDCSLMANEYVDAMMKAGWSGVVCKVDIEKAYDHVNWGYVDWVLN